MSSESQKSIFDIILEKVGMTPTTYEWELRVDGASRGNPGPSGAGIYLSKNKKSVVKEGFYLKTKTNNEAEYLALLIGVLLLKKEIKDQEGVVIISDSQLIIRQLEGIYKIKKPELKKKHKAILTELGDIPCQFKHIEREYNTVADLLANKGVDTKKSLSLKFLDILRTYEIFI